MRALSSREVRVMVDLEGVRRGVQGEPDPQLLGKSKTEEAGLSGTLNTLKRACLMGWLMV